MMKTFPFLLTVFMIFNLTNVSARPFGPSCLWVHHTELVKQTNSIIVARASDVENVSGAKFETIEVIKGDALATFIVSNGRVINQDDEFKNYYLRGQIEEDFDGHRNLAFWDSGVTRAGYGPDCKMHPQFVTGKTYLIFLDNPHTRAYEEINTANDLWLAAVRKLVDDPTLKSGLSLTLNQWIERTSFAFIAKIDDCKGTHVKTEVILNGKPPMGFFSDSNHDNINPECKVGTRFFVASYLPYLEKNSRDKRMFGEFVKDNNIDFSRILEFSQIEFLGSKIMDLKN
ncbi:MAG: hypothetical protein HRU29_03640 [Rhizobiales bacterium]|nr:hypothetical protein [Hyphomicrobiales bacterium]NRB13472.1 hypothetical protein [Hyphomicrobiales bacterium]